MKITKDMFSCWEYGEDYDILLDDELIISIPPDMKARDMADYILMLQEKYLEKTEGEGSRKSCLNGSCAADTDW